MCYIIIKQLIKADDVTKCNKYLPTQSNNICSSEISVILIFYKY